MDESLHIRLKNAAKVLCEYTSSEERFKNDDSMAYVLENATRPVLGAARLLQDNLTSLGDLIEMMIKNGFADA
jgi:hypothetical protein